MRKRVAASIPDCTAALQATDGNVEAAIERLTPEEATIERLTPEQDERAKLAHASPESREAFIAACMEVEERVDAVHVLVALRELADDDDLRRAFHRVAPICVAIYPAEVEEAIKMQVDDEPDWTAGRYLAIGDDHTSGTDLYAIDTHDHARSLVKISFDEGLRISPVGSFADFMEQSATWMREVIENDAEDQELAALETVSAWVERLRNGEH